MFISRLPNQTDPQKKRGSILSARPRMLPVLAFCLLPIAAALPGWAQTSLPQSASAPPPVAPTPATPTAPQISPADPLIGPIRKSDVVSIQVADEPALSGQFRVTSEGKISLPLAGQIELIGQMPGDAADTITGVYKKKSLLKNPQVVVTIIGRPERMVFVAGALDKQGRVPLTDKMRLDEVLEPSGISAQSDLSRIIITRGEQKIRVDYLAYRTGNDTLDGANNPLLEDGDKVYVRARIQVAGTIKISGEVKTPQTAPLAEKLTAAQALQQAGGVTDFADRDKVVVVRNGKEIVVPYKAIQEGQTDKDILLQDKDTIFVRRMEAPKVFYVNGGVVNRNTFPLVTDMTLNDAIAAAGGVVDGVNRKKIVVQRKNSQGNVVPQTYDLTQTKDMSARVQPDDIISVPYPPEKKPSVLSSIGSALPFLFFLRR